MKPNFSQNPQTWLRLGADGAELSLSLEVILGFSLLLVAVDKTPVIVHAEADNALAARLAVATSTACQQFMLA
jgi:hypothetical protein